MYTTAVRFSDRLPFLFLVMRVVYKTAVSFSVLCLFYPGFIGFTRVGTDFCRSDFAFAYEVL